MVILIYNLYVIRRGIKVDGIIRIEHPIYMAWRIIFKNSYLNGLAFFTDIQLIPLAIIIQSSAM